MYVAEQMEGRFVVVDSCSHIPMDEKSEVSRSRRRALAWGDRRGTGEEQMGGSGPTQVLALVARGGRLYAPWTLGLGCLGGEIAIGDEHSAVDR